MNVTDFSVI